MTRGEWLDFRRTHVGGSDVAAIMGLSPWRTPYQVWAEKVGLVEPEDIGDRPRVEWGTRLEADIAAKFAESHLDSGDRFLALRRPEPGTVEVLVDDDRPWAMATLDGVASFDVTVEGPEGEYDSYNDYAVFEAKTAHFPTARDWGESGSGAKGVPAHYLCQVDHYLSVTGWERAYVAVLIDGWDYREYVVERDEDDIRAVTEAVDRFWHDFVEAGVAPEVTAEDEDAVLAANPVDPLAGYEEAPVGTLELVEAWREAKDAEEGAEAEYKRLSAELKQLIGDAKGLTFPEGRLTWTRTPSLRFSEREFRKDHPDLFEEYRRPQTWQRLTWKDAE